MLKSDVICIGSATVDNFLSVDLPLSQIRPGYKVLVHSLEKHSGGGATNAAAAIKKFGLRVKLLTKLGHDHDADFIEKELRQLHLKNLCQKRSQKSTDFSTIISSTRQKDRIIYVHKGASLDLTLNDFRNSRLNARWIYLATLMGRSFRTAKSLISSRPQARLLFNPSLYLAKKGKAYLRPVLRRTDLLVLNKEEAQALLKTEGSDPKNLLLRLQKLGPGSVVITNGPQTLHALDQNTFYSLHPPQIKVVHTAGAGDAFTAAFLAALIKKCSFAEALQLGQANASSVIRHLGTKNKLLTEKEARHLAALLKIKVSQHR